jgi:hypothetical protein
MESNREGLAATPGTQRRTLKVEIMNEEAGRQKLPPFYLRWIPRSSISFAQLVAVLQPIGLDFNGRHISYYSQQQKVYKFAGIYSGPGPIQQISIPVPDEGNIRLWCEPPLSFQSQPAGQKSMKKNGQKGTLKLELKAQEKEGKKNSQLKKNESGHDDQKDEDREEIAMIRMTWTIEKLVLMSYMWMHIRSPGDSSFSKPSAASAALELGVKKKTLDAYFKKLVQCAKRDFSFNAHRYDPVKVLDKFIAQHQTQA